MDTIQVAVVNATGLDGTGNALTDDEVQDAVEALQAQVDSDFGPVWHASVELTVVGSGDVRLPGREGDGADRPLADHWALVLLRDAAQGLGYHELTHSGLPLARVSVAAAGDRWTLVASHELLEMLVDPYANLTAYDRTARPRHFLAMEVCDPVEAERDGYCIQVSSGRSWMVSDFVYPTWFQPENRTATRYDHLGRLENALTLREGGYSVFFDTGSSRWLAHVCQGGRRRTVTLDELPATDGRGRLREVDPGSWALSDWELAP